MLVGGFPVGIAGDGAVAFAVVPVEGEVFDGGGGCFVRVQDVAFLSAVLAASADSREMNSSTRPAAEKRSKL